MFCNFIQIDGNRYQCEKCNTIVSSFDDYPPILPCSFTNISSDEPDLVAKVKNFSSSLLSHAKNNFTMADDAEIERRFRICETCEFFKNSSCSQCGCPINRARNYVSKLSWASEKCPVNKW